MDSCIGTTFVNKCSMVKGNRDLKFLLICNLSGEARPVAGFLSISRRFNLRLVFLWHLPVGQVRYSHRNFCRLVPVLLVLELSDRMLKVGRHIRDWTRLS